MLAPLFDRPFIFSMGPQRCGTSWLDQYLRARGDICLPNQVKETFFFDRHYHRGGTYYRSYFRDLDQHRSFMEVSTTAFDCAQAPQRLFESIAGQVSLVCPLRDPVKRSYSLYVHYKRYGIVRGSLQEACEAMPQILTSSHYARHLQNWDQHYPLEDIAFFFQEELDVAPEIYLQKLCHVLQADFIDLQTGRLDKPYNAATRPPSYLLAGVAQRIAQYLRRADMFWVINAAKKAGLKPLFFGGESKGQGSIVTDIAAYEDDIHWLSEQLSGQVQAFENLTGVKTLWHS